jgi:hypothetical protein
VYLLPFAFLSRSIDRDRNNRPPSIKATMFDTCTLAYNPMGGFEIRSAQPTTLLLEHFNSRIPKSFASRQVHPFHLVGVESETAIGTLVTGENSEGL